MRIPHLTHYPISPAGKPFAPDSAKGWNGFRSANKQNEITSVSGATTPAYDNNGNLTKDENNYRFVYDAWNRQVIIKNASDAVITTNAFDGINRNVKVVAGSSTIDRIFSDGWQLLEEKSGSNTLTRNVLSPVYVDALVLRDRDTDANGTFDERLFVAQDANYNVTAILNASGTVQERYTYTPFGLVTYRDASGSAIGSSTKAWVFLHQGGQINIVVDYDFRNRVLSPTLGRWLTNDPLGFAAGDVNTYRYVGNGPGNNGDPTGLEQRITPPLTIPPYPGGPGSGGNSWVNPYPKIFPGGVPINPNPFPGPFQPAPEPAPINLPGGNLDTPPIDFSHGGLPWVPQPFPGYSIPSIPPDSGNGIDWAIKIGINTPIRGIPDNPIEHIFPGLFPPRDWDLIRMGPRVDIEIGSNDPGHIGIVPNQPGNPISIGGFIDDGKYKFTGGFDHGIFNGDWRRTFPTPIDGITIQPSIGATINPVNGDYRITVPVHGPNPE